MTGAASPGGASVEWLSAALGVRVDAVESERIGADAGFAGEVHRLRPIYADRAGGGGVPFPSRLILKTASRHAPTRRLLNRLGAYRAEADFYRFSASESGVAPRCFFAEFDERSGSFRLLLEDLSHMRRTDGFSSADALAVADALGRLHALFCSERGRAPIWAPKFDRAAALFGRMQAAAWRRMPPDILEAAPNLAETARRAAPRTAEIKARLARPPFTLVHGDARADNLFFGESEDGSAAVKAIDWQAARLGRGAYDLAYFMATSLDVEVRRAIQDDMARAHSDARTAAGCECYPPDSLREDIRASLLDMAGFLGIIGATLDFGTGKGLELARTMMKRLDEALADNG